MAATSSRGCGAAVDDEADAEVGFFQAGLAEQPVLQRVGVEAGPGAFGRIGVAPGLGQVAGGAGGEAGLVHAVAQDIERLVGGEKRLRRQGQRGRAAESLECLAAAPLVHHGVVSWL
jgi:hypothetical protein